MIDLNDLRTKVIARIADVSDLSAGELSEATVLIGPETALSSRELVEVLLELEEFIEDDYDVEFDWTSDSALSVSHSFLRTVGTLIDHLHKLVAEKK
jgi:hypothetical protein